MAGINIDANIQAKGFLKGIDNMSMALEGLQDDVSGVQKDGDKSLEKLEKSFAEVAKASRATGDTVKDTLGKGTKAGVKEAEEGLDEFKRESNSTAKESAASFDGSAESIVDSFQEVAANAFAGFGPAGILAGLTMAAGIGLATKAIEDGALNTEEFKKKVSELTTAFIESADVGTISAEQVIDKYKELAAATEDGAVNLEKLKKASKGSASSFDELAAAISGDTKKLDELIAKEKERLTKLEDINRAESGWDLDAKARSNTRKENQEALVKSLEETQAATEDAARAEKLYLELGVPALESRLAMQGAINDAYDETAGAIDSWIAAEGGVFDTAGYITAMQEREKALTNYQETLAGSGLSAEAKTFLNEQGIEAAAKMLEGYKLGEAGTKAELNRIWTEAGKEGSGAADKSIKETFKTPTEAKVQAKLDEESAKEVQQKLNRIAANAVLTVKVVDRNGKEYN